MEEEDVLRRFGTPLKELDEDEIPSKKPINVDDQIVTDANGKRRFHGAFTGGFSAGFWNTVGSLEGWKPQEFKSSRAEKAEKKMQRPEDFMDDEDLGEFGIAPQAIQTTENFTNDKSGKRKFEKFSDGPIPGVPVLKQLLQPAKETIAIKLLKQMGWKEGQGVGARITRKEKEFVRKHNQKELYLMEKYGCDIEQNVAKSDDDNDDAEGSGNEYSDSEILFAPDDYDVVIKSIKDNYFGLGYSGLSREGILGNQFTLFDQFEVVSRNNKKFSISGQAFGVGALEEEDEDIYAKDDLTRYDFTLENKKAGTAKAIKGPEKGILEDFTKASKNKFHTKEIFKIEIPIGFKPRNWSHRKSRFEPLDPSIAQTLQTNTIQKTKNLGRHDLKPTDRGEMLNDNHKVVGTLEFIKSELLNTNQTQEIVETQKKALKITENLLPSTGVFQPFQLDSAKQSRYEKFLEFKETPDFLLNDFLKTIQPDTFNNWDREMERKEFIHAKKLYKPLKGLMLDRFITEAEAIKQTETEHSVKLEDHGKEVTVKRSKSIWKPCALLCKRFNINNPYGEYVEKEDTKKKSNFSIFNYIEANLNDKKDFVAPIIIPKKEVESDSIDASVKAASQPLPIIAPVIQENEINLETAPSTSINPPPLRAKPILSSTSKSFPKSTDTKINSLITRVKESTNVHPSNKKDLFKCIFESSDEEDSNEIEDNPKTNLLIPKLNITDIMQTSANEINKLRNNSPPRGIFANLFTHSKNILKEKEPIETVISQPNPAPIEIPKPKSPVLVPAKSVEGTKIKFRSREERQGEEAESSNVEINMFGPKLPDHLIAKPRVTSSSNVSNSNAHLLQPVKIIPSVSVLEDWIEKDKVRHKKKNKDKDKEKHKKKKNKKDKKNKK